jgi:alkanesulfonate monooxygenase SsuD/methylene tetrahydromethanopterin reductase-like flavin-dependent oxidoreductase (luciferase family)
MQFGIHLLGLGRRASVKDCISAAQAAEELGCHSVWINDHVVIPSHFRARQRPNGVLAGGKIDLQFLATPEKSH